MEDLPSGTVTLLFTDVEGSTLLVQELGAAYQYALDGHRQILRDAVALHAGREVDCRADEFLACFPRASDGLAAAIAAQLALTSQDSQLRVRMGLHTGEPELIGDAYIGIDVNRAARICAAGHGGQILVSQTTRDLASTAVQFRDLGTYLLAGVEQAERIYEVRTPGLRTSSLPLRAEHETSSPGRRRRGWRPRRPASSQLAETAWRSRKLVEPGPLREALTGLAAALFDADRAVHRADALLGKIDRQRIARRLAEQRQLSLVSAPVAELAAGTDAKLACLDRLGDDAQVVSDLGAEAAALLDRSFTAHAVEQICERLNLATDTLDGQITVTARAHDALSYRLARTRWRGVYRLDGLYVVPYHDELGIERQPEFTDAGEARRFRHGVNLAHQAKNRGPNSFFPWGTGPG
ncbi:MAG TPA: adenylate/guanylate cyclase domain-containing protein [Gaiellales bacterium]|nr:adenylate/guanylate cyclase domain-containing protein [Gaiellales bacterium]